MGHANSYEEGKKAFICWWQKLSKSLLILHKDLRSYRWINIFFAFNCILFSKRVTKDKVITQHPWVQPCTETRYIWVWKVVRLIISWKFPIILVPKNLRFRISQRYFTSMSYRYLHVSPWSSLYIKRLMSYKYTSNPSNEGRDLYSILHIYTQSLSLKYHCIFSKKLVT
jgi:hypothetical protein